jgi:hypothetical protein
MQTNKELIIEFARGACLTALAMGIFFAVFLLIRGPEDKPQPENRFKVVDKYGPCEVVRYSPKGDARSAYFLDCK